MDIKINQITKKYDDVIALDKVDISIPDGATVGVIGHNGSGKTTFLEILSGLKSFDSGEMNYKADIQFKQKLGIVLQNTSFYDDAKVDELLKLFSSFYKEPVDLDYIRKAAKIENYDRKFYKSLSGGMKQKVNIALALVNDPKLLILDEPTTGLDPLARVELWEIIRGLSKKSTILVSSHYMDEIEKNCDFLVFLKGGKVVECGYLKEILEKNKMNLEEYYLKVNGGKN